ncbi:hypothetical protein BofuT4_uP059600.1 [Botrytis cinerea T4]|uniref:Uncharacterized protein n=1 Tax=Botryotinia fuckeliana (strain T4) TaxID=999810 RepID=G2XV60_BOTF4|nr:hypothetical protein BofuT4_uP059600.1 [Botrytis cinerea T4]
MYSVDFVHTQTDRHPSFSRQGRKGGREEGRKSEGKG